jgi:hypothetical protein
MSVHGMQTLNGSHPAYVPNFNRFNKRNLPDSCTLLWLWWADYGGLNATWVYLLVNPWTVG